MIERQIILKPKSVRELRKYLKPPLSEVSAVIYFYGNGYRPFLLDQSGGISSGAEYRLRDDFKIKSDMLDRIVVVTVEVAQHDDS
jgi:hypothetical protein